jgi:hypothetical protein
MNNRLVVNAIAKVFDPSRSEDLPSKPIEDADIFYRTAIIFTEVTMYDEYVPNPLQPYYRYKGPLTRVYIGMDYEKTVLIDFERFDQKYQEAMQFSMIPKIN